MLLLLGWLLLLLLRQWVGLLCHLWSLLLPCLLLLVW
jgi:hypothetical protein